MIAVLRNRAAVLIVGILSALVMTLSALSPAYAEWTKYCGHSSQSHYHNGYKYTQIYIGSRWTSSGHQHKTERHIQNRGLIGTVFYTCPRH